MAILRNPNKDKFTVVDNYALRDGRLSLKARGLLTTMISLPDNWKFSEIGLCAILPKDGQSAIRSGLKELESNGYLTRTRVRGSDGRISEVVWTICDKPQLENQSVDNQSLDNPNLGNQPQLNTYKSNTDLSSTEQSNTYDIGRKRPTPRFVPPTIEEVRAYCQERKNNVDPERFRDFYEANGWKQGRGKPIKDWKAAVRTWERNDTQRGGTNNAGSTSTGRKETSVSKSGGTIIECEGGGFVRFG